MHTHLVHSGHKLCKSELAIKVFVECSESLAETLKLFEHAQIDLLENMIESSHFLGHFHQRVTVETIQKIYRLVPLVDKVSWSVLENLHNVK